MTFFNTPILETLAAASGVLMAAANFPQAIRIFRRKSAVDVSFTTWITWTVGTIIWLIYGISIKNFPIILCKMTISTEQDRFHQPILANWGQEC